MLQAGGGKDGSPPYPGGGQDARHLYPAELDSHQCGSLLPFTLIWLTPVPSATEEPECMPSPSQNPGAQSPGLHAPRSRPQHSLPQDAESGLRKSGEGETRGQRQNTISTEVEISCSSLKLLHSS